MIVITAPTSNIGRQVLDHLLPSGQPLRVIARDPARLPEPVRANVEVVQGSHSDSDVVNRAFAGADTLFWLVPADPGSASIDAAYVDFSRPACDAIRRQGVKRVVVISALGRGTAMAATAGHVTASLKMCDLIESTGVACRALALPSFMDNVLRQIEPIKNQGVFYGTAPGDHRAPTCATRDIAATAARLLLDQHWSGQGEVAVLGPEDLSFNEMAQIMSDVLGKPVRYQEMPLEILRARLTSNGYSTPMAQAMIDMMTAKNAGLDNAETRNPQSTTPTSFRQWCIEILRPALAS